jgi:alanyl-tRNA synthetase
VHHETLPKEEAFAQGALGFFAEKYGDMVSVYTVGQDTKTDFVSKELCGGPHVMHTAEIGEQEIFKEQSVAAGVRRIYMRSRTPYTE